LRVGVGKIAVRVVAAVLRPLWFFAAT